MIRSKDLFLFLVVFLFLCISIFVTISKDYVSKVSSQWQEVIWTTASITDFSAETDIVVPDRESEIERLKKKLSENQTFLDASLSVETPQKESVSERSLAPFMCGLGDEEEIARNWPLENVSVTLTEGARVVQHTVIQTSMAGTSTGTSSEQKVESVTKALLQLPVRPVQTAASNCLPSEVVGVTVSGSLIFNADALLYRNYDSDTLIGYARDGFPIYGPYEGQTDECGGYENIYGYRYIVSSTDPYLLTCYKAQPQSFMLP